MTRIPGLRRIARERTDDHAIEDDRAGRVEHLEPRRRHVRRLAREPRVESPLCRAIAADQVAALGQLHGLVAEALDGAQHEVEPDGELAIGILAQSRLEA